MFTNSEVYSATLLQRVSIEATQQHDTQASSIVMLHIPYDILRNSPTESVLRDKANKPTKYWPVL